jgi:C-terminal processing protease CtpA/Prc
MLNLIKSQFKIVLFFATTLLLVNCSSADKFNKKIAQPISVAELQKDIDYVQRKLDKFYPSIDLYIPKQNLDAKFDSLRNAIKQPMTSKEFYFAISPIIASVRQGHMTMSQVPYKLSKKEAKRIKKAGDGPLSQFSFEWLDNKLYIIKNKSKNDKIKIGTEVVSINKITPQELHSKYRKTYTSDGFNTTFLPKIFSKRFATYMTYELGVNDSLNFFFKEKDSLFSQVISRKKPDEKIKAKVIDSAKVVAKPIVDKAKLKAEKRFKKIYGYDTKEKEYTKEFKILPAASSVAVLKIRNFSKGHYHEIYEEVFDSIKKAEIKTLIIDLRDNPGGRMAEIQNLYSYLTNEKHKLTKPSVVTSRTSLWRTGIVKKLPIYTYPLVAVGYPFYMGITYFKAQKVADRVFTYKTKLRKPDKNNFSGKVYVLINGMSFSASCVLSAALQQNPKVTFVGEETGGALKGTVAGFMPIVKLPNSKLSLRLGLIDIQSVNQSGQDGRGIFPNVEIKPTIQDKVEKKDPEMEWVMKQLGVKSL